MQGTIDPDSFGDRDATTLLAEHLGKKLQVALLATPAWDLVVLG